MGIISSKKEELTEQEARIESAVVQAFVTAGQALKVIRDSKLYLSAGFDAFERYCEVRWQMQKSHAYRLIDYAGVLDELSVPHGGRSLPILPSNERIARELTPLLPAPPMMRKAWKEVVITAPKNFDERPVITAKHGKEVVHKYRTGTDAGGAFPGQGYRVVYADPPWKYNDKLIEGYGAAEHHYPPLSIDELCELKDVNGAALSDLPAADAVLFMWVTSPMVEDAFKVINAWGFDYKTSFVWDKLKHNYGHYNSVRHELLLIGTCGSCTPDSKTLHDSVVTIKRSSTHSEKPLKFLKIIDAMYPLPEVIAGWLVLTLYGESARV